MSGIVLPPGTNGDINIFKPPWERPTPEGTQLVLSTLPKELIDHIVDTVAAKIISGLEARFAYPIDRAFKEDGA